MAESTFQPTAENHIYTQVKIKNLDETESLIDAYLHFDGILPAPDGRFVIYVKWSISEVVEIFDDITTTKYVFQESKIKWSPSATYLKDGVEIVLGTLNVDGTTTITRDQAIDYITADAANIAGYAMKTRTVYVG